MNKLCQHRPEHSQYAVVCRSVWVVSTMSAYGIHAESCPQCAFPLTVVTGSSFSVAESKNISMFIPIGRLDYETWLRAISSVHTGVAASSTVAQLLISSLP